MDDQRPHLQPARHGGETPPQPFAVPHPDTLRAYSWPIYALGLDELWNGGLTGKGILVCVIDAGLDGSLDAGSQMARQQRRRRRGKLV